MVESRICKKTEEIKFSLKEKILKYLIENKETQKSIRQIAKEINTDYKNTFQAINNIPSDLISKTKFGNINLLKINLVPKQEIYSIEDKRTQLFLQENKQLKLIQDDVKSLNYPFFIVSVFGSIAKKTNISKSDIDICIISDNKSKIKELISKISLLPLKLEIHDFSSDEFKSMLKTKEQNIAKEIIKKNVLLYGIENYYNLISKWTKNE